MNRETMNAEELEILARMEGEEKRTAGMNRMGLSSMDGDHRALYDYIKALEMRLENLERFCERNG